MKYKLIATDLDGTLLTHPAGVTEKNRQAIQHAISKGVQVAICSGRIYAAAHYFAQLAGSKGPIISSNGAAVRESETGKLIHIDSMDINDCLQVIEILKKAGVHFNVSSDRILFSEILDKNMSNFIQKIKGTPEENMFEACINPDIAEEIRKTSEPILKVIAIHKEDPAKLREVRTEIEKIDSLEVTSSGSANFEVLKKGANKGRALEILCSHLGISREETIAFGDNENDISMLEFAGLSIVMGNGIDCVKNIADYVTAANVDDGVGQAIMKFIP